MENRFASYPLSELKGYGNASRRLAKERLQKTRPYSLGHITPVGIRSAKKRASKKIRKE